VTRLSVVLPVYDERPVLEELHRRLVAAVRGTAIEPELLFVDDGSRDGSGEALDALAAADPCVRVLHLARNFGHQAAVQCGLDHATGDAVVVMDSDLQDLPEAIPALVEAWRSGHEVVYAVRTERKEGGLMRALFAGFYRALRLVADVEIPLDAGNFGLLDRRVVEVVRALPERDRYYPGLRSWVGFRQIGIPVERGARYHGRSRVGIAGLLRLAKAAVFSFSTVPLTVFYVVAALAAAVFLGLGVFTLYHRLVSGQAIPGWTSILLATSFFGGLNALGIAILGEIVTRIYDQVRERPLYVVRSSPEPREADAAGDAQARPSRSR
jgi:dolichol-phosphate mannosyltransferase